MTAILLVDDHAVVRAGTRLVLSEGLPGAEFGEASTTAEGLAALEGRAWDLVLLDLSLPGRGGLDLLEEARRRWPKLPVLVLSAHPEEEFAVRCLKLGAAGYVTKAAPGGELLSACRTALEGRRYVTPALAERLAALLGGDAPRPGHEALSQRELEVLRMVARGRTLKEIAAELSLSEKTISTYRQRISAKLGVSTNVELTRYALQHRLVE
ncbi:MAG: response regulator transcription factor [Anaeromyxobacter sp.]